MGSEIHSQSSTSAVDRIRRQGKTSTATDQDNLIELSSLESSNSNFERSRNTVDYHGNREDDTVSSESPSVSSERTQILVFANPFLGTSDQGGGKTTSWSWDDPPSKHGNDEWLDTPGISHGENLDQSVRNCRQGSFAPHLEGMESIVRKIRRVSRDREIDTPSRSEKNGPLGHACDGPASSTQNSRSVTKEIRPSSLTCGDKDERGTNINLTEVTTSRSGISRILSTLQHSLKKTRSGQDASPKRPGLLRLDTGSSTYSQDDLEKAEKGDLSSRGCCKRQSRLICILLGGMIGIVIAIILVFYAWSVEVFWGGEMAPGKYHSGLSDALRNHTAMPVKRRWLHSHNDEMHGRDALALALKYGFGSIEADVWLGPVPKQSSPSSSAISSATAASSEVKRRTVEYVGSIHSSQDTIVHLPVNEKSGLVPRGAQPDPGLTLLIGHKTKDLTHRTLAATYLEPLMTILEANNRDRLANQSIIGLYKDDPSAEVQLVIDMKNDGDMTWPYLVEALQPLIDKGYLSTYNQTTSTWSKSAIMVIGTGNTPIHRVYYQNPRTIFYDAPLKKVSVPVDIPATDAGPAKTFEWDSTISPMASDKFPVIYHVALAMPPWNPIINNLRRYTFEAAKRGIASRWWGFARKPAWVRRRLWEIQKQGGVDWTNADDLKDAERWLTEYEAR